MNYYWMQQKDFEELGVKNVVVLNSPVSIINHFIVNAVTRRIEKMKLLDEQWLKDLIEYDGVIVIMGIPNDEHAVSFKEAEYLMVRMFDFNDVEDINV